MVVKKNSYMARKDSKEWLILFVFELISCVVMGLVLVWSNIERMDTTYFINIAQNEIKEKKILKEKLEVEFERFTSPYELRKTAEEMKMHAPDTWQIRVFKTN